MDKNNKASVPEAPGFFELLSEALLRDIPLGICVNRTGLHPEYIIWNKCMEKITGISAEKALGCSCHAVFDPINAESIAIRNEITTRERAVSKFPNNILNNRILDFIKIPILNQDDEVTYIVTVTVDITEQREMLEKLVQAEKLQMVGQLAGGIAHDFNNQLMAILGYTQLLKERVNHPELSQYLGSIIMSAEKSAELTAKLLAYSSRGKLAEREININDIIEEVLLLIKYKNTPVRDNVIIEKKFSALKTRLSGDAELIQNTLFILLLNSMDAMPEGGKIEIYTENVVIDPMNPEFIIHDALPGEYLKITVSDTGTGIKPETINRIFEPFFTTKKKGEGAGMGLAAVFGTIKSHKGTISLKSALGKGTSIAIYFPSPLDGKKEPSGNNNDIHRNSKHEKRKEFNVPMNNRKEKHIMVVDDEKIVRDLTGEMLSRIGYSVILFDNAVSALEYYKKSMKEVDLVILDMIMPHMGGKEAFYEFKAVNPEVLVIVLSGFSMDNETQDLINEGIVAFIQKPVSLSVLKMKLEEVFNTGSGREDYIRQNSAGSDKFFSIEGVDTVKALENLDGDRDLYLKLVERFKTNYAGSASMLLEKYAAADYNWIHTFAHSMKSLAGNLGAGSLVKAAEKVELSVKKDDLISLKSLLPDLAAEMDKLLKAFASVAAETLKSEVKTREKDKTLSAGYLEELHKAVKIQSPKKSHEYIGLLKNQNLPENAVVLLAQAEKLIDQYRFRDAREILADLLRIVE